MELVSCPTCHAAVEPSVTSCPLCGTAIVSAPPSRFGPPVLPTAAPNLAGWGAAPVPPGRGAGPSPVPAPIAPAPVPSAPTRRRRSVARLLLPVLVVVALGAAAITWWSTRSDGNGTWETVTTASGRFRVELPETPVRTTEPVDVTGRPLVVDLLRTGDLSVDEVAAGTMFVEVDLSSDPMIAQLATDPSLAPALLYAQAGTVFSTAGMELGPVEPATSSLGPAIGLSGTVPGSGLVARGWMVGTEGAVLAVLVIEPDGGAATATSVRDRIVASVAPV